MRLSRPRVLLRAALLVTGAGFMFWKAWQSRAASRALEGAEAALAGRIAVVFALVGLLALLTGAVALASLRRRPRVQTLQLEGLSTPPSPPPGTSGILPAPPGSKEP